MKTQTTLRPENTVLINGEVRLSAHYAFGGGPVAATATLAAIDAIELEMAPKARKGGAR